MAWFLFLANWTGVTATFIFERIYSYFIYNVYGPSVIVVIISWVGFVIPRDTPAARVTLAVTAVLTIVTILTILNSSIAKVRHANFYTTYCLANVLTTIFSLSFNIQNQPAYNMRLVKLFMYDSAHNSTAPQKNSAWEI